LALLRKRREKEGLRAQSRENHPAEFPCYHPLIRVTEGLEAFLLGDDDDCQELHFTGAGNWQLPKAAWLFCGKEPT
jgi:hypothetical protein